MRIYLSFQVEVWTLTCFWQCLETSRCNCIRMKAEGQLRTQINWMGICSQTGFFRFILDSSSKSLNTHIYIYVVLRYRWTRLDASVDASKRVCKEFYETFLSCGYSKHMVISFGQLYVFWKDHSDKNFILNTFRGFAHNRHE